MQDGRPMIHPRPDYQPTAYDDDFEDIPTASVVPKWIGGIVTPVACITYAIHCFSTRHGLLVGQSHWMDVYGANAVAVGVACSSVGLMLHCHYFWGNVYHLFACAVLAKIASLIGLIASLGYLTVHVGILGH
jgi:hypothetical protein